MRTLGVMAVVWLAGCSSGTSTNTGGGTGGSAGGSAGGGAGGSAGGGAGGGGAGGGTGSIALADYCTKVAEWQCATQKRCGTAAPNADCAKVATPSRFSLVNARTDCLFVDLRTALTAGTATYHGDKAAACLARQASCNAVAEAFGNADCTGVFTGTKAQGSSCRNSAECLPALYCDATLAVCPGTCQPRVPSGGAATTQNACGAQAIFILQNDGGGTCQDLVAPGGNCTNPPGGFTGKFCTGDAYCAAADGGVRTCEPRVPVGTPCSPFAENCTFGSTCGAGDGGMQCVAYKKIGEACPGMGLGIPCQTGLSCVNAVCAALVAAGGACFEDTDCAAGHVCGPGQVCRPFGTVDAGCTTANFQDDCGVGLFCDKPAAKCAPRRGRDALCPNGNECSIELGFGCNTPTDGGPARCAAVSCINP